jgi:hypothetical protein
VEVAASTGNARKRARKIQHRLVATVSWQKGENHIIQLQTLQPRKGDLSEENSEGTQAKYRKGLLQIHHPRNVLRGGSTKQGRPNQQSHPHQDAVAAPDTVDRPRVQTSPKWQKAGQSTPAQIVNSFPQDNMVRVVTAVQQFMTEYNDAVSKEAKIQAISKTVLNLLKQNGL